MPNAPRERDKGKKLLNRLLYPTISIGGSCEEVGNHHASQRKKFFFRSVEGGREAPESGPLTISRMYRRLGREGVSQGEGGRNAGSLYKENSW